MASLSARMMTHLDVPAACRIELGCVGNTFGADRWKILINSRMVLPVMAFKDDKPTGVALAERIGNRKLVLINLLCNGFSDSFCDFYRCEDGSGAASILIAYLKSRIRLSDNRMIAEVDECNLPAQKFFRSQQFEAVKILEGADGEPTYYRMVWRAKVLA